MSECSRAGAKPVDVLLVNPPSPDRSVIIRDFNRSGRTSKEKIIWPQISLAYLASMVPSHLSVAILDCIAERMDWDGFQKMLRQYCPRYMACHVITSVSTNDFRAFKLAKEISGTQTLSMGPHVTELTKESFLACPPLDYILRGEPEITFKELLEALEKRSDLARVDGLAWREGERIIINKPRSFIENLDDLPMPRHDLLPIDKYVFPFIASNFTFVMPSRGCPYPCTFCRQPIMWEKKVRSRSPESVIAELKTLKESGVKNILFQCDTFTLDRRWVIRFCQMMMQEKLEISWGCNSRVDTVDPEVLGWMKRAGCWMIAYGVESGSDEILRNCQKGATVQNAVDALLWTHEAGIKNYAYFVFGLPGETAQTMRQSAELAKRLPVTFALFHTASPYPGTAFHRQCLDNHWLKASRWEDINQGGVAAVSYPNLSSDEIMLGIQRAYKSFYLRPSAVLNILKAVRNPRDLKHLFAMGMEHFRW